MGQVPGVIAPGELFHLWERGVQHNELCECGEHFWDCPFWTAVGARAFNGWRAVDSDLVVALTRTVTRHRHLPYLRYGRAPRRFRNVLTDYLEYLSRLYGAITHESGCRLIVDSSKHAPYVCALRQMAEVRIIHLVRDSRGVAYSSSKRVHRPERGGDHVLMPHPRTRSSARQWLETNTLFEVLRLTRLDLRRIRYEDYVRDSSRALSSILAPYSQVASDPTLLASSAQHTVGRHSIGGNPMRFRRGPINVTPDLEWRAEMPRRDRLVAESLTWPLLLAYGYYRSVQSGLCRV
jgi:hypothetical protein